MRFCLILGLLAALPLSAAEPIRYGRDIRPILSDKCFFCHGPDPETREEDLRLDIREEALAARAFVPGNPAKSRLIKLINATDPDDIMPPPESHKSLTAREKQLLHDWIQAGAEYEPHWAYIPPTRTPGQSIDALVATELKKHHLAPSPPADPHTLLRRLHLDVTGLPPSPPQVAAFLDAHAKDPQSAITKTIDDLLASPHFGERMAVSWLDAVRYADTVGYHGDQERSASPFRDYVIGAFNRDLPFDQFTIEQLAGDLLPDATLQQKTAAAYNRLNPLSEEGGIQDAEYLAKYQAERVRTTSSTWLGSTLACSECHDHKFDPFTAKDFYSFAAYFGDILEKGAWNGDGRYQEDPKKWTDQGIVFEKYGPVLQVPTPGQSARLAQLDTDITDLRAKLDAVASPDPQTLDAWIAEQKALLTDPAPRDVPLLDETLPEPPGIDVNLLAAADSAPVHSGTHSRRQEAPALVQHIATLKEPVTIHENDTFYLWVHLDQTKPTRALMLQANVGGEWAHRAYWGDAAIPYGRDAGSTAYHHAGDLPKAGEWVRLAVPALAMGLKPGAKVGQIACTQFGGLVHWDNVGLHTTRPDHLLAHLPTEAVTLLKSDTPDRERLALLHRQSTPEWQSLSREITDREADRATVLKTAPTVPATLSAKPREIRLLPRGDWQDTSGPVVDPSPPAFLSHIATPETGTRPTRLDLARWIVHRDNPLTARVFANRLWAQLFGTGLSSDTGDLGLQGEFPKHPELLDWLAIEFMENGWSVKHLVRTILLSQTYQQASTPTESLAKADPQNRLLARQSQLRLPAELIRDNALSIAGILNPAIGGPSVKPYQPAGYYRHLNFPAREYQPDTGTALHRRGLYTHWQRTFLHPMLKAFDAPAREECATARPSSNTPLQALNLLNDPTFTEAARALAVRLLTETPEITGESLAAKAFLTALGRPATDGETTILAGYHASELTRFTAQPDAATAFLKVGSLPNPPDLPPVQLAAATSLARAVLNLHETITRY